MGFVTPKKNAEFTFYISLISRADTKVFQANPTLATGDVKVAIDDGAPANLATLPVVDADYTRRVKVVLSASEMNGDNITLIFADAAGAEWCDLTVNIQTSVRQIDDLAFPATSGRSILVEADGMIHADVKEWLGVAPLALASQLLQVQANQLDATARGQVNTEVDTALDTAIPGSPTANSINERLQTLDNAYTAARAAFLDNLNVGGLVASQAEAQAIQNNTRVVRVVPTVIERPDSGTVTYRIELLLYDDVGNMEAPDSAPTIALVNQAGTDLSGRLDSSTMALVETGRYRAIYTASVGDTLEQLVWTFSVVEGGATRKYGNTSIIVDTSAVDFTAADRAKLDTLHDTRLTAQRAANLDLLADATVGLAAIESLIDELETRLTAARAAKLDLLDDGTVGLAVIEALVDELESRLTAARALLLDNIGTLTIAERAAVADKFLGRSIAAGADGGRTVQSAFRRVRNRVRIAGGTMTVYEEDDATPDHTAAVTTAAGNPISELDPA